MYGKFKCGHSKKPSNRKLRGDGKGCGYGCKTCRYKNTKDWFAKNPDWNKKEQRKLRQKRIALRMKNQRGRCAICKRKMKHPYDDHNHETKQRRGLLCPSCNGGLHLVESKRLRKAAIAYLKHWETQ